MISLQILFIVVLVSFGDAMKNMPEDNCRFDTLSHIGKHILFVLEADENPDGLKNTEFKISGRKFTLSLTEGLKTYVNYVVPSTNVGVVDCEIRNNGVTIKYEIQEEDPSKKIKLDRGKSVGMVYGGVALKLVHDKENRKSIPFSVEVLDGSQTRAKMNLGSEENDKFISVDFLEDDKNYVMVGEEEIEVDGDSFDLDFDMDESTNIIVTNLPDDRPTVAEREICYLTCLSKPSCPFNISTKHSIPLLKTAFYRNLNEKTYIVSEKTNVTFLSSTYTYIPLQNEELEKTLYLTLGADIEDISNAPTILLTNSKDTGHCKNNPCLNGGACNVNKDNYKCMCKYGFNGVDCENQNLCSEYYCQNAGICVEENFKCLCKEGFSGFKCETKNRCMKHPCQNGGKCVVDGDSYKCLCEKSYTGVNCETAENQAKRSPSNRKVKFNCEISIKNGIQCKPIMKLANIGFLENLSVKFGCEYSFRRGIKCAKNQSKRSSSYRKVNFYCEISIKNGIQCKPRMKLANIGFMKNLSVNFGCEYSFRRGIKCANVSIVDSVNAAIGVESRSLGNLGDSFGGIPW